MQTKSLRVFSKKQKKTLFSGAYSIGLKPENTLKWGKKTQGTFCFMKLPFCANNENKLKNSENWLCFEHLL